MNVPNALLAYVEPRKLAGYLLNESHEDGKHKARALKRHGYSLKNAHELESVLLSLVHGADVAETIITDDGTKYILIEELPQSARFPPTVPPERFRIVWQVDRNSDIPRLITAYPQVWREKRRK